MRKEKGSIMVMILPLLATLILSLGITVYNSAQTTIQTSSTQNMQQEKDIYNSMIKKYIGDSKKGSDVKQMIDDIISQNSQYANESGKFISIHVGTISGYNDDTLEEVTEEANSYENSNADNTIDNVNVAESEYRNLKQKINTAKNYNVTKSERDGVIYAVTIAEENE